MDAWRGAINAAGAVLGGVIIAGLIHRRRARRCGSLLAYVALNLLLSVAASLGWSADSWLAWVSIQVVQRVASLAVAVEIAVRTFASLPGAAPNVRRMFLAAVVWAVALLFMDVGAPLPAPTARAAHVERLAFEAALSLLPRLAYATAWLFTALLLLGARYMLPLDPLHRVVMLGFAPYLVLHAVSLGLLRDARYVLLTSDAQALAFVGLLALWAHAAWRREHVPPASRTVVARLWPWA